MHTLRITALCTILGLTASALEVGKPSPPFTVQRINNSAIPLSQYQGKILVLAFIDTECPHCQHLTGVLNTVIKEYEGKGVQFVECAFNDGAIQLLPGFIQKFQPSATMGYSPRDPVMTYLAHSILKPLYVPHLVFLDRKGIVRGDFPGESDFMNNPEKNVRAEIDELLKPASSPSSKSKAPVKSTASAAPSHP